MTASAHPAADRDRPAALLETRALSLQFGGHRVLDRVSCDFHAGTLTALVGPNGAGKTSWFNLVSGQLAPTGGHIRLAGEDITHLGAAERARKGIGRAFQRTQLFPHLSVLDNAWLAAAARTRQGPVFWRTARRDTRTRARAMHCLEQTGLAARADDLAAHLPHGDQRKLEVALLLALEPRVFMFDEPTAGMGADETPTLLALIGALKQRTGVAILLVEHKLEVVHALSDRIVVLHDGHLLADGPPAEVMASKTVRQAYLGQA